MNSADYKRWSLILFVILSFLTGTAQASPQLYGYGSLTDLQYSPDGRLLVTGTNRGFILWNARSRQIIRRVDLSGALESFSKLGLGTAVAFSPDGRQLAAAAGTTLRLWDVRTFKLIRSYEAQHFRGSRPPSLLSLSFSPSGDRLAAGATDGRVRLWAIRNKQPTAVFHTRPANSYAYDVSFSGDGRLLAAVSGLGPTGMVSRVEAGSVRVWNLQTRTLVFGLEPPSDVKAVALSPNGKLLAVGSFSSRQLPPLQDAKNTRTYRTRPHTYGARLYSLPTGKLLTNYLGLRNEVRSLAFSPDGTRLAGSATTDRAVVWRVADGRIVAEPTGMYGGMQNSSLSWHPNGQVLAYGTDMGVRLWNIPHNRFLARLQGFAPNARLLDISSDGKTLAAGSYSGLRIWSIANGRLLQEIGDDDFKAARFSSDGEGLFTVREENYQGEPSAKGRVFIEHYAVREGKRLESVQTPIQGARAVTFSRDRRFVAIMRNGFTDPTNEGIADLFALPSGRHIAALEHVSRVPGLDFGRPAMLDTLAFSQDGSKLAVSTSEGVIWLWNVSSGRLVKRLLVYKTATDDYGTGAIAWSPDRTRLLVGAQIYDVASGNLVQTLHKQEVLSVYSMDWLADGQRVLVSRAGGYANKLTIWQVDDAVHPKLIAMIPLKYSVYRALFGPGKTIFLEHWLEGLISRHVIPGEP